MSDLGRPELLALGRTHNPRVVTSGAHPDVEAVDVGEAERHGGLREVHPPFCLLKADALSGAIRTGHRSSGPSAKTDGSPGPSSVSSSRMGSRQSRYLTGIENSPS